MHSLFHHVVVTPRFGSRLWNRIRDEEQEGACHLRLPCINLAHSGAQRVAFSVQPDSQDFPLPSEGTEFYDVPQYVAGPTGYEYYDGDLDRPRVPLIVLAQQGQHLAHYPEEYIEETDSDGVPLEVMSRGSRLSTITEITERTDPSRHWPSKQQLIALNNARASTATDTTTSYGQVVGAWYRQRFDQYTEATDRYSNS